MKLNTLIVFVLNLVCCFINAQEPDFGLTFIGHNMYNQKELLNTNIKITTSTKTITEISTAKSNSFKTKLAFGNTYNMYFTNTKCQTMYITIFADIPANKQNINTTYELEIPFFSKDFEKYDTSEFKNAFHQILFNGKNKFVDDTVYMNQFFKKIKKKIVIDTVKAFVKQFIKTPTLFNLSGKLTLYNKNILPIKNKEIELRNNIGEIIAKTKTTNNGIFIFENIDTSKITQLFLTINKLDNPNNDNLKLENENLEIIDFIGIDANKNYNVSKTLKNKLLEKLITQQFKFNIGGKLIETNAVTKNVFANKTIYLLDENKNQLQQLKTNTFGVFLFRNVAPNKNYSVAVDSAEIDAGQTVDLYTVKDKFVNHLDAKNKKKFHYQFISTTYTPFNDLIIDDTELKMNVKGRFFGDNKNNPLSNMKIILLNEKYEKIDSAITNEKGDYLFKYLQYNKQVLMTVENEKNILESFNNILVFDNDENLIKIVSLIKGGKFEYQYLTTNQSTLTDVYIDDPWLKLLNKDFGKNKKSGETETIIESILFEFGKADLLSQSKQTLDKVILVLKANKLFKMELGAHSDSKGSDLFNLKLSEQRALSAKNYLLINGIDDSRIIAKGYGEIKLRNNCGNAIICSDDEHAINRRLEFKIIYN